MSEITTDIVNKVFAGDAASEVTELIKSALYSSADELLNSKRSEVFNSIMNGESEESDEEDEEDYETGEDESAEPEEEE